MIRHSLLTRAQCNFQLYSLWNLQSWSLCDWVWTWLIMWMVWEAFFTAKQRDRASGPLCQWSLESLAKKSRPTQMRFLAGAKKTIPVQILSRRLWWWLRRVYLRQRLWKEKFGKSYYSRLNLWLDRQIRKLLILDTWLLDLSGVTETAL